MNESVKKCVPDFLKDEVVFCEVLTISQKLKSCLILLRSLIFYEFHNKIPNRSIDLSDSWSANVKEFLAHYQGIRGKLVGELGEGTIQKCDDIRFGKFIYQNFEIKQIYLLIKCWNEFVIIQRTEDRFLFVKKYDQVATFSIVHGKIKFQAMLQITYQNGTNIKTDLQDVIKTSSIPASTLIKNENFKQLMERIRSAKTELLVHKSITLKDFQHLKNTQTFGCNFLRSLKIDEKMLLARCGDVWQRITPTDNFVIGVSLINNASPAASVTIKNIRPIFKTNEASLNYSFRFHQLQQQFKDLESVETFFQCDEESSLQADAWITKTDVMPQLSPNSFIVLCTKLNILQLLTLKEAPLFIYFEIEKDASSPMEKKSIVFQQQLFIKNIEFADVIRKRRKYEISFTPATLHQDFLAIASSGNETKLNLTYDTEEDFYQFERLLSLHFDLERILRSNNNNSDTVNTPKFIVKTDSCDMSANHSRSSKCDFAYTLYYNKNPMSIWYGTLFVKCADKRNASQNLKTYWKIFTEKFDKAFLLIKHILAELALEKCNIKAIEYPVLRTSNIKVIEFENALRNELNYALLHMRNISLKECSHENAKTLDELLQLEMKTDLVAISLDRRK